jgi:hypothetical protein
MQSAALWRTLNTAVVVVVGGQVLGMHKLANRDLACSKLGWRPAQARVQIQQFAYMWRLMHEAPARTRALHRELAAAPPLTAGYAVGRACGPARRPWYSLMRQDMKAVLGAGATTEWCVGMGKSKWTEWVQSAVDHEQWTCTTADTGHWIQRIEAKLAKPLAEAAAPEALVGRVVHKPAAAFGRGGEGMLAGLVTGYNADRLTWGVDYDDEARQGPEGLGAADMRLYGPEVDAGDAGDVAHRAVWREYLRSHGGRVRAWYLSGPPAMARWHVNARTNGGLAGSYGRMGLAGRVHCSTYAGTAETTMHTYLHCLPAALRAPSAAPSSGRGCMCQ